MTNISITQNRPYKTYNNYGNYHNSLFCGAAKSSAQKPFIQSFGNNIQYDIVTFGAGKQQSRKAISSTVNEVKRKFQEIKAKSARISEKAAESSEYHSLLNTTKIGEECKFNGRYYTLKEIDGALCYCSTSGKDAPDFIYRYEVDVFEKIQSSFKKMPPNEYLDNLLKFLPEKGDCLSQENLLKYLKTKKIIEGENSYNFTPLPTFKDFHKKIQKVVKTLYPNDNPQEMQLRVAKYLNEQLRIITPEQCNKYCKTLNKEIEKYAQEQEIDKNSIYYIVPKGDKDEIKSFDVTAAEYAMANNIPLNKFIRCGKSNYKCPDDAKLIVVLDDIVISGSSFSRILKNLSEQNPESKIFVGSFLSTSDGGAAISRELPYWNINPDKKECGKFISAQKKPLKYVVDNDIMKMLLIKDRHLWSTTCPKGTMDTSLGFNFGGFGIGTWYMGADNNSALSGTFLELWVPRGAIKIRLNT